MYTHRYIYLGKYFEVLVLYNITIFFILPDSHFHGMSPHLWDGCSDRLLFRFDKTGQKFINYHSCCVETLNLIVALA